MTGWGLGNCTGDAPAGFRRWSGRFGRYGGGAFHGRRFGRGRDNWAGRGWGYMPFRAGPDAIDVASYEENEKDFLDRELTYLKGELETLQKRRDALKDED
jgi:hypothetical protein